MSGPHPAPGRSEFGRVRIACEGDPLDPASWSGTPAGLAAALGRLGLLVDPVDVTPLLHRRRPGRMLAAGLHAPAALRWAGHSEVRPVAGWLANSSAGAALQRSARYRMVTRRRPAACGVIRMRGQFNVGSALPSVILDDLTLAQAFGHNWRGMGAATGRFRRLAGRRQRSAYREAVACGAASRWAAMSMIDDYGVPSARVHVVGCGVNGPVRDVPRDWSLPRFLFISMHWSRKNGDAVVSAFERLRREQPAAELALVGDHPRVDQEGVRQHGLLPRNQPDAQQRLRWLQERATCLVMPSQIEPFGLVYVEAGAVGVPSIGTTVGGAADAVGPGGVLVDPHRPEQLLDAMRRLSDPSTARRYGELALRHAERCTWDAVARRLVRHLLPGRFDDEPDLVPVDRSSRCAASTHGG